MWILMVKGGPLMWPLLACSLVAIAIVLERCAFWRRTWRRREMPCMEEFFRLVEAGDFPSAKDMAVKSDSAAIRVMAAGLQHYPHGLREGLESAASAEAVHMRRGLHALDTIITLAPLLGILGTVAGIIRSFDLLGQAGMADPQAVTGGISQALITTAAGLTVAIIALLPYNALSHRADKYTRQLEHLGTRFEIAVRKGAAAGPVS